MQKYMARVSQRHKVDTSQEVHPGCMILLIRYYLLHFVYEFLYLCYNIFSKQGLVSFTCELSDPSASCAKIRPGKGTSTNDIPAKSP